jgi:hypothetical protein
MGIFDGRENDSLDTESYPNTNMLLKAPQGSSFYWKRLRMLYSSYRVYNTGYNTDEESVNAARFRKCLRYMPNHPKEHRLTTYATAHLFASGVALPGHVEVVDQNRLRSNRHTTAARWCTDIARWWRWSI